MPQRAVIAVGCGALAALFYLSVLTGSRGALILVYLAQLPLFLAGLSMGAAAAAIAAGTAATILLGVAGGSATAVFLAVDALPVLVLTQRALLWRTDHEGRVWFYPPGRLVVWLVGLGVIALVAMAFWFADLPGGLADASRYAVRRSFGAIAGLDEAVQQQIAAVFPGVAVMSWLLMATLNGVLAQGVLARFGLNRRPSPDPAELELPRWAPIALGVAALIGAFGPGTLAYVSANAALLLVLAFLFGGLGVLHAWTKRFAARPVILLALYVIVIAFGWPILLVAALGFLEQWVGLRQRFAVPAGPRGDE